MLLAIESTEDDALQPEDYHKSDLALRLRDPHPDAAALEVLLTDAYVKLYAHQHGGRVDPSSMRPRVISALEREAIIDRLENSDLSTAIADLQPTHPDYAVLKGLRELYLTYAV